MIGDRRDEADRAGGVTDIAIWSNGRVQPTLLQPVGRLGGSYYASLGGIFSRPAPTVNLRG